MPTPVVTAGLIAVAGGLGLGWAIRRWQRLLNGWEEPMVVVCPAVGADIVVRLDARCAATRALFGSPRLRVASCPRGQGPACAQACVEQIENAPSECRLERRVARWYAGRRCVLCGWDFGHGPWDLDHALLGPDGRTREWRSAPAESIPSLLATHRPICWKCHAVESLRREHPELVVSTSH